MQHPILSPIVSTLSSEVAEVALLATALTVALHPGNLTCNVSVGNASGDIPAQKQSTKGRPAQVKPASNVGTAEAIVTKNDAPAAETKASQSAASEVWLTLACISHFS